MTRTARAPLGTLLFFMASFGLCVYFTFAAVQGDFGLFRRAEIEAVLAQSRAQARLAKTTLDRVREALFSMLASRGVIEGAQVLDLFAGTGALGLEALSRGAAAAVFVENGRVGQRLITDNIAKLKAQDQTQVMRTDATRLAAWTGAPFDLVFLDPPYG